MQRILRDIFGAPRLPDLFGTRAHDLEPAAGESAGLPYCAEADLGPSELTLLRFPCPA